MPLPRPRSATSGDDLDRVAAPHHEGPPRIGGQRRDGGEEPSGARRVGVEQAGVQHEDGQDARSGVARSEQGGVI